MEHLLYHHRLVINAYIEDRFVRLYKQISARKVPGRFRPVTIQDNAHREGLIGVIPSVHHCRVGTKNTLRDMECDIPDRRPVSHWLPEILHLRIECTPYCEFDSIAVTCCETSNQRATSPHPGSRDTDQRINIVSRAA
jgi:hypothetical protein